MAVCLCLSLFSLSPSVSVCPCLSVWRQGHIPILNAASASLRVIVCTVSLQLGREHRWLLLKIASPERPLAECSEVVPRIRSLDYLRRTSLPYTRSPRLLTSASPCATSTTTLTPDEQRWQEVAHIIETLAGQVQALSPTQAAAKRNSSPATNTQHVRFRKRTPICSVAGDRSEHRRRV